MSPAPVPTCRPVGTFTASRELAALLSVKLNEPSWNSIPLAVLPIKEPPRDRVAPVPKVMPLGLNKNRLAVPVAPRVPLMREELLPVTRPMIFVAPESWKVTVVPAATPKSVKLWKRLPPAAVPPVIVHPVEQSPVESTVGVVPSITTVCAQAGDAVSRVKPNRTVRGTP